MAFAEEEEFDEEDEPAEGALCWDENHPPQPLRSENRK